MNTKNFSRQVSTGTIAGLSSIVYAISHGALLFYENESNFLSMGMTVALTTALIFALGGCFFKEKTFVMGTDTGVVAVMASSLMTVDILSMPGEIAQATILAIFFSFAMVATLVFYLVARFNLSSYVRYIPFSVMAGLLAATGWLICSAALTIISELTLSIVGLNDFIHNPIRPELLKGCLFAILILGLSKKISSAILMPLVIILSTLAVHLFLNSPFCFERTEFMDPFLAIRICQH
jgi:SulP family sulfate permease